MHNAENRKQETLSRAVCDPEEDGVTAEMKEKQKRGKEVTWRKNNNKLCVWGVMSLIGGVVNWVVQFVWL